MNYTDSFIPAGFQVHVTSYENDGDNYQTHIITGLSKPDMMFYVDLAIQFKGDYGNTFIKREKLIEITSDVVKRHPIISYKTGKKFSPLADYDTDENSDNILDELTEFLGRPGEGYYDGPSSSVFVRRATKIEVYYLQAAMREVDIRSLLCSPIKPTTP